MTPYNLSLLWISDIIDLTNRDGRTGNECRIMKGFISDFESMASKLLSGFSRRLDKLNISISHVWIYTYTLLYCTFSVNDIQNRLAANQIKALNVSTNQRGSFITCFVRKTYKCKINSMLNLLKSQRKIVLVYFPWFHWL